MAHFSSAIEGFELCKEIEDSTKHCNESSPKGPSINIGFNSCKNERFEEDEESSISQAEVGKPEERKEANDIDECNEANEIDECEEPDDIDEENELYMARLSYYDESNCEEDYECDGR